ncbi:NADH-quinone oxidoreductase subunit H [Fontisphaera persica]|uniref:complex I subunit 1/NuoH family protein n=1 Tax=Fontisphaera persica TaxID=2974023 RepID=UPI0024C0AF4E|nr:complex I subunit 1 family protein [Fontisphaera persica]WCJ60566.1 NADH-quinone oxidoreductase subunit H [Fontisphaera persica]
MDWFNNLTAGQQFALFSAVKILGVFAVLMFMVAYVVLLERRLCAAIQDRVGPNRAGPGGIWQPIADAVKSFLKEDFMPAHVRRVWYWLAPAAVMIPGLVTVAVIPFGSQIGQQKMVIADLNVGILYTFGIVSLGVYGIVLAGYAANSKYPFLGGIRSSAQMISYEIAMGLSVIPVLMLAGDLNLSRLVAAQTGWLASWLPLPNWMVFQSPMTALAFLIFLAAAFAETNRLPFDLPEAEQELAGGYNVEYSSIKFALFFMGEYANMIAASAMMVTLFFGGWTLPWFGLDQPAQTVGMGILHILIFLAKVAVFMVFFIWVRWMLPRFRYDQLMDLGWRRFVPLGLANILAMALWLWWRAGA